MEFVWDASPFLRVGGFSARYYSLIYAVCAVLGWKIISWQTHRGGGRESDPNWLIGIGFVCVWLGGRLAHFLFYEFETFVADPAILFEVRRGGMSSHGAFLMAFGFWVYARIRGVRFLDVLDRISFSMCMGAVLIRIGNLMNSEVVGRLTDQTWGVRFPRYDRALELAPLRHPSQIYEAILGFVVLCVILAIDRRLGEDRPVGLIVGVTWFLYFLGRFFVEFFKEHQALASENFLTMGQWLSVVPCLIGLSIAVWSLRSRQPAGYPDSVESN